VYAASKVEQRETQAPASITIVTSDEIKKYGYRTLADILRSVPGFNVSYDRDYAFLGGMSGFWALLGTDDSVGGHDHFSSGRLAPIRKWPGADFPIELYREA